MPRLPPETAPASRSVPQPMLSKLTPPQPGRFAVERLAISERVFLSLDARLILIRAPAGFGKTTAMAQLRRRYEQDGVRTAWLNLDDADNDVPRLLNYLGLAIESISALLPDDNGNGPARSDADQTPGRRLFERLGSLRSPFALFLDEFETLRNPVALAMIGQLIDNLPPGAQLLIGSRQVPDIGLARLRARGALLEVEPGQLRFTAAEASDFLMQRRGLALKPGQVERLHRSTEGWVAALWLASVALERRSNTEEFINSFAGSNAAIADYLSEDVFAGQSLRVQEFLLKTSILDQLDAALCDAVCGGDDSSSLLEQIERANLFLVPLDEEHRSYRYHNLFRDFLKALLKRRHPEWQAGLHRRAAEWFIAEDRPVPAINHALCAEDSSFALPLLERNANSLLGQGRMRLLARWLDRLAPRDRESSLLLRLVHAWAVNFTRGSAEALALIEGIDAAATGDADTLAQLRAMRPLFLGMRDRIDESYALGVEVLPQIPVKHGFARGMLAQGLANASMMLGRHAEARAFADEARRAQFGQDARLQMVFAETVDASIDLMQGRLQQALVRLRQATEVSGDDLLGSSNRNVYPGVLLAEAIYETGDVSRAERGLGMFLPLARQLGLADQLIISHTLYARIVGDRGDSERALQILAELETAGYQHGLPRVVASARIERVRALIARGDFTGAQDQLNQSGEAVLWQQVAARFYIANDLITLEIGRLRWLVRSGAARQALPELKAALEEAEAGHRQRRALKLRMLLAEALHRDTQKKAAMRMLSRALEAASAEGFVSSFMEEGPVLHEMLRELLQSRQHEDSFREDEPLNRHLQRVLQSGRSMVVADNDGRSAMLAEALTRKELQVLELLAKGYSNNSMAEKLFVSETTVRTHLRNINVKLQAGNRMQAIAIARRLRLIA